MSSQAPTTAASRSRQFREALRRGMQVGACIVALVLGIDLLTALGSEPIDPRELVVVPAILVGQSLITSVVYGCARRWRSFWGLLAALAYGLVVIYMFSDGSDAIDTLVSASFAGGLYVPWLLGVRYLETAERARAAAAEAGRLRALAEVAERQARFEPHFVLNALNAVAGLVTVDPHAARRVLGDLGQLLRRALDDQNADATVAEEIEWLRCYARVLEARYPGRLVFEWRIEEEIQEHELPRLLLQPLLENAVHHGALRSVEGPGRVTVSVAPREGALACVIEDNGPESLATTSNGVGLDLVRRRLLFLDPTGSLTLVRADGCTRATVLLPIRHHRAGAGG